MKATVDLAGSRKSSIDSADLCTFFDALSLMFKCSKSYDLPAGREIDDSQYWLVGLRIK
jgi:hypothetical protein